MQGVHKLFNWLRNLAPSYLINMCQPVNATFHYSSQLQTWSQADRTHVESPLRTCLKWVFSTFHLSSTRMNQRTCSVRDKKKSKACRKPARTCRKPGYKPGRKPGLQPGLQLARIMECGLYKQPSSTPSAFRCAWRPRRSTDEDSPLRSMQLCCRWAGNVKCATCTITQRRNICHVISSPAED